MRVGGSGAGKRKKHSVWFLLFPFFRCRVPSATFFPFYSAKIRREGVLRDKPISCTSLFFPLTGSGYIRKRENKRAGEKLSAAPTILSLNLFLPQLLSLSLSFPIVFSTFTLVPFWEERDKGDFLFWRPFPRRVYPRCVDPALR